MKLFKYFSRKGIIRFSFFSAVILTSIIISLFIFSSFFSSAVIDKSQYQIGESVKLDLHNYQDYNLKIKTPSNLFFRKGNRDIFLFKPEIIGEYTIIIDTKETREEFAFDVVDLSLIKQIEKTEKNYSGKILISENSSIQSFSTDESVSLSVESNSSSKLIEDFHIEQINKNDVSQISPSELSEIYDSVSFNQTNDSLEVNLELQRSFKPGVYKLSFDISDEHHEILFAYGLVSLNTKRSIYSPGEKAELEAVVLDSNGVGVCDSPLQIEITNPSDEFNHYYSSQDGSITAGSSCGLYQIEYTTTKTGTYLVNVFTEINEYNLSFSTIFLVSEDIQYEIFRNTQSKIDPTQQEWFHVDINISSNLGIDSLNISETIPAVFEIKSDGVVLTEDSETKIIQWNVNSSITAVSYDYKVPPLWPYLYQIGPLKVNNFTEFRPWYIAVDPAIVVSNLTSRDIQLASFDNHTFVVAWIGTGPSTALQLNFQVWDTNGTNMTSIINVTNNLDANSRVAVLAVNSTQFVVAWDDGDSGSQDMNNHGYFSNGSTWFADFESESGIGVTPDIKMIALPDRYQMCYIDQVELDADVHQYLYGTPTTLNGVELGVDGGANPDEPKHNLFECAAVNSTRVITAWFDDSGDTAAIAIYDNAQTNIVAQTNIDNIGLSGQVAITALNNQTFVMAYYDSALNDLKYIIRNVSNAVVLGVTTIDTDAGIGNTTVSIATIRNHTTNRDDFVIAWYDNGTSSVYNASVFDEIGNLMYSYTLLNVPNVTSRLFDVYGRDTLMNLGICDNTYLFAYSNSSGSVVTETRLLNGSISTGYCDFNPPYNISIHSPRNITYNDSKVLFNISILDLSPVTNVTYSINFGANNYTMVNHTGITWNATNASVPDGNYTAWFYANDINGNLNNTFNVTFTIDTTGPRIRVNSPLNESNSTSHSVLFNITTNELSSACYYTLTNGVFNRSMSSVNNFTFNATNSSVPDGIYIARFYCNDTVSNLAINTTTFRIDSTAPRVNIVLPQAQNYSNLTRQLNFTINDSLVGGPFSCQYSLNYGVTNITILNCDNTTLTASEGNNFLYLYINDSLGNLNNTVNVSFFVDTILPLISFSDPTPFNATSRNNNFIFVNISITELNIKNITYELYNMTNSVWTLANRTTFFTAVTSFNWSFLNFSFKNYTYNVSVYDVAGNTNFTETRTITLTLGDISPPDITFNSPLVNNFYYNTSAPFFKVTLSENASAVLYSLNRTTKNYSMQSSNNIVWNATNSSTLDGNYTLFIYANDTAGNLGTASRNFTVDTTKPFIVFGIGTSVSGANLSQNFIFVNVTMFEINEANITFNLYNISGLVNSTTFITPQRTMNWTSLLNGTYYYNVSARDLANNFNVTETRVVGLDVGNPNVTLNTPIHGFYSANRTQNFTVNITDDLALSNITLSIFNFTESLINQTSIIITGASGTFGIEVRLPYDGFFNWSYLVYDSANNFNRTQNFSIFVDETKPLINFTEPTPINNSQLESNDFFVNVTASDTNFVNITFTLFNTTSLVNRTTFTSLPIFLNFTNLSSVNITYFYNVSVRDITNNFNVTETRTIKLTDNLPPTLSMSAPLNRTYFENTSIPLTFSVEDVHLASCWYSIDQVLNISIPSCASTQFDTSEGSHALYLYANDSLGLLSYKNISFSVNASLFVPYSGILAYTEGTNSNLMYRIWNGTGFNSRLFGLETGSGVNGTFFVNAESSPSRAEYIVTTQNNTNKITLQINSTLYPNNQPCWHNGSTCGSNLTLPTLNLLTNRSLSSVAYETIGDDALVVWSQGNVTPLYRVWNGTGWGQILGINQSRIQYGNLTFVKLMAHPFRDEISMIMSNETALNVVIWNGTGWGCEPTSALSNRLTINPYQHADLAYEQVSGDLFVASNINGATTEIDYTTKLDGSCSYTISSTTTLAEQSEMISVGARYGSNHIMISQEDISGDDMHNIVWSGSSMLATSPNEISLLVEATPSKLIASAWAGTSDYGLVIYSDASPSLNLDYMIYNISTNAWDGTTAGLDASGITNFNSQENWINAYSYINQNRTLILVKDSVRSLWAKGYNGDTKTWFEPDGGRNLSNVSSGTYPGFDFNFNDDRAGPQIIIRAPLTWVNSTTPLFNVSTLEDSLSCVYRVDDGIDYSMTTVNVLTFQQTSNALSQGVHNVTFNCSDIKDNTKTESTTFFVDSVVPVVNFTAPTRPNATSIELDWIFVNVSVTELNETNITFTLYNSSGLVNISVYNTTQRTINWTGLVNQTYYYNVSVRDIANNFNVTETRTIFLTRIAPNVNLSYPSPYQNISGYAVSQFNFSVIDQLPLANCSLYGNWTSYGWHRNQTVINPLNGTALNFSSIITRGDGFYLWNVLCTDTLNSYAFNSTNFTFSTFLPPDAPVLFNISQNRTNGQGNVTLFWLSSNHTTQYRVYNSSNLNSSSFSLLIETTSLNFTDLNFSGNIRRFYRIDSLNPLAQNISLFYFGAHVYSLAHNGNTRNLIAFPTNASYLRTASMVLADATNATAFTSWNNTVQRRVTCNSFSCPTFPACTDTNCNFDLSLGAGYELNINNTVSSPINWSLVGIVHSRLNLSLYKNSTSFGINWVGFYANTTIATARGLIQNVTNADAVSNWNATQQTSQGLIPNPFGSGYLGNNFQLVLEKGYEVSVTNQTNWTQG